MSCQRTIVTELHRGITRAFGAVAADSLAAVVGLGVAPGGLVVLAADLLAAAALAEAGNDKIIELAFVYSSLTDLSCYP